MTKMADESIKVQIQEALDRYKKDRSSCKEFYPCSKELTQWLQKQGEQK